jgi:hypothetical protein
MKVFKPAEERVVVGEPSIGQGVAGQRSIILMTDFTSQAVNPPLCKLGFFTRGRFCVARRFDLGSVCSALQSPAVLLVKS